MTRNISEELASRFMTRTELNLVFAHEQVPVARNVVARLSDESAKDQICLDGDGAEIESLIASHTPTLAPERSFSKEA